MKDTGFFNYTDIFNIIKSFASQSNSIQDYFVLFIFIIILMILSIVKFNINKSKDSKKHNNHECMVDR